MTTPVEPDALREEELIRRAVAGDVGAFERLYRDNVGRIFALCLRMVADRERAEDLTQRAFVRGWERLGSFRGESAFATWLHRLAANLVFSEHRNRQRRERRFVDPGDDERHEPAAPPLTDRNAGIDLERAIANLPERARQVFVLHDVEGYGHKEIAALIGMAEGTSKAHLHRARQLLREALTP